MTEPMKIKSVSRCHPIVRPRKKRKTAAMNRGMGFVTTPLVIFTDANTFINPQAVREIVKCLTIRRWDVWQEKTGGHVQYRRSGFRRRRIVLEI